MPQEHTTADGTSQSELGHGRTTACLEKQPPEPSSFSKMRVSAFTLPTHSLAPSLNSQGVLRGCVLDPSHLAHPALACLALDSAQEAQVLTLRGLLVHGLLVHSLCKRHAVEYGVNRCGR